MRFDKYYVKINFMWPLHVLSIVFGGKFAIGLLGLTVGWGAWLAFLGVMLSVAFICSCSFTYKWTWRR